MEILATTALASAAAAAAKELYPLLMERLKKRDQPTIQVTLRGQMLEVQADKADELLSLLEQEIASAKEVPASTLELSRQAAKQHTPTGWLEENISIGSTDGSEDRSRPKSAAFGIDPSAVLADARRRIDLVFKINLAIAIALAVILIGGLTACVFSAVVLDKGTWALVFGGISAADLLGVYMFKPLDAVNSAVVATQRLDTIHLRLREQLSACLQHKNITDRIACQTSVWDAIQSELASLAGTAA